MFIVTNCTKTGNYTPSVFDNLTDALNWLYECTSNNIKAAVENIDNLSGMTDKEICI